MGLNSSLVTTEFPTSGVPLSIYELTPLNNKGLGCGGMTLDCARNLLEFSKTSSVCLLSSPGESLNMVISSQIMTCTCHAVSSDSELGCVAGAHPDWMLEDAGAAQVC